MTNPLQVNVTVADVQRLRLMDDARRALRDVAHIAHDNGAGLEVLLVDLLAAVNGLSLPGHRERLAARHMADVWAYVETIADADLAAAAQTSYFPLATVRPGLAEQDETLEQPPADA